MSADPDKELEEELTEIVGRIERLRVKFQQYFMGTERFPPTTQQEQLERKIRHSALNEVRRSSLKFRFLSAIQRLRTFEIYWERVQREIEAGRYRRGLFRDGGQIKGEADRLEKPSEVKSGKAPKKSPKKAAVKKKPAKKDKKESAPAKPKKEDRLYRSYIEARQSVDLPVEGITPESFNESLTKQRRIQAGKLGADDVSFTVKIKAGKVILEARRKKADSQ